MIKTKSTLLSVTLLSIGAFALGIGFSAEKTNNLINSQFRSILSGNRDESLVEKTGQAILEMCAFMEENSNLSQEDRNNHKQAILKTSIKIGLPAVVKELATEQNINQTDIDPMTHQQVQLIAFTAVPASIETAQVLYDKGAILTDEIKAEACRIARNIQIDICKIKSDHEKKEVEERYDAYIKFIKNLPNQE